MGASGWTYFVPYQADIPKALQQLREEVFHRGAYFKPAQFYGSLLDDQQVLQELSPEVREFLIADVKKRRSQSEPSSIEELIEMNGESGTHSILDIEEVSSAPAFGVVAPLTNRQSAEIFGTDKPTRSMVKEKLLEIQSLRSTWQGTYIVLYKDGIPDEILFIGSSGD
jgi:hypothetical protein